MGAAVATFTATGQATTDNGANHTSFNPGIPVTIGLSDGGSFSGTVALQSRFVKADNTKTAWETIKTWTAGNLPVRDQFDSSPGFEYQLYAQSVVAGSVHARMGN